MKALKAISFISPFIVLLSASPATCLRMNPSIAKTETKSILPQFSNDFSDDGSWQEIEIRGGASDDVEQSKGKTMKRVTQIGSFLVVSTLLWVYREHWIGAFNKEKLQTKTLEILHELNALPKYRSYATYTLGMAAWETLGLSTIPVETAAGMVFGWPGFALSAIGKLVGAVFAFGLARYGPLAEWVQMKLSGNEFLQLVQESAGSNAFMVSILLKFSCFPETIKNYGSAIIRPIKLWMFVFGTVFHGWMFSALWTYLGVDAAMRLNDPSIPADTVLQTLLSLALINGVVVSPLAMAYWFRTLREHSRSSKTAK